MPTCLLSSSAGKSDRAGGVIWRAKDANNYYVARANALEDNVAIYHTINGRRTEKKRANVKVASNVWHTLRVDFAATHFTVTYDGAKALEWDDATFKDAGKVGVWTKADSVTLFDDFAYGERASSSSAVVFVCEHGAAKSLDDVPDDKGYGPMRDAIKRHVERLIDDMSRKRSRTKNQERRTRTLNAEP